MKPAPVPDDGLPPVAVQEKVYGVVPPEPVAVKLTGVPVLPLLGPLMVTDSGSAAIVIVADLVALTAFALVAVTVTVYEPLTLYVVMKVAPVPEAGLPPDAAHAKV